MKWKASREVLLIHSGQRSSSQSWCEHDGGSHDNTGLNNALFMRKPIHLLSQTVFLCFIETQFISMPAQFQTYFPRREQNPRPLSTITFDSWTCFRFYVSADKHRWGQNLIWSVPDIISAYRGVPFSTSVLFDNDTLLICSVLVLWLWNYTPPLTTLPTLLRCAGCTDSLWVSLSQLVLSVDAIE